MVLDGSLFRFTFIRVLGHKDLLNRLRSSGTLARIKPDPEWVYHIITFQTIFSSNEVLEGHCWGQKETLSVSFWSSSCHLTPSRGFEKPEPFRNGQFFNDS